MALTGGVASEIILDLFAGPGGADLGMATLGIDTIGIEVDPWACATRRAAGLRTIRADVAHSPTEPFAGRLSGLWGSPPCTAFSQAGNRDGHDAVDDLVAHAELCRDGWKPWTGDPDPLVWLVLEPLRWTLATRPRWVVLEQVPPVLPIWDAYGRTLRRFGYRSWAGKLNAADYGVPQTRERAFLMVSLDRQPWPPDPTHSREPGGLFGLRPWVSMAEALGWDGLVGFPRRDDRGGDGYRERDLFSTDGPAPTLTEKGRSWTLRTGANFMVTGRSGSRAGDGDVQPYERSADRPAPTVDGKAGSAWRLSTGLAWDAETGTCQARDIDEPSPTVSAKSGGQWILEPNPRPGDGGSSARTALEPAPTLSIGHNAYRWAFKRPATTVMGDPRIAQPGHKRDEANPDCPGRMQGAIRISVPELGVLQGFPADYPWQGNKSRQATQVGNAVPPPLAAAIVGRLVF